MRMIGSAVWRGRPATIRRPTNNLPALPSGISKEKELLQALERHGEVTAVQAALETSLSVAQAEEMLSELANEGHVRVSATGGRLAYALWE
jgi:DNA-binding IclR family transcriptional regulator